LSKICCFILISFFVFVKNGIAQKIEYHIADTTQLFTIASINIQGFKKTKLKVIARELTFEKENTFSFAELQTQLETSQQNIFNTALFLQIKVLAIAQPEHKSKLDIFIEVKERFYILPEPLFDLYDRNYKVWRNIYNSDIHRIRYGIRFKYNNFTGNRDVLRINLINGFSKEATVNYSYPYLDKKMKWGLQVAAGFTKKIGISYIDSANAGLPRKVCATCVEPNFTLFQGKDQFANLSIFYRNKLYARHQFSVSIVNSKIADTIATVNPNFFTKANTEHQFVDINYTFFYNKVDYFAYPTKGMSMVSGLSQRFTTNNLNQTLIFARLNKYWQLNHKINFATQLATAVRVSNNSSFYNLRSTNVATANIRGFEQYLLVAKNEFGFKNTLSYQLLNKHIQLPRKIKNHEYVPIRFYINAFIDAAYITTPHPNYSVMHNRLLNSKGIGIDMITIYDYVLRFEMSYNKFAKISFFVR
jgi:outer membrane protein assembly factor BamA